jgi:hypothetical protein
VCWVVDALSCCSAILVLRWNVFVTSVPRVYGCFVCCYLVFVSCNVLNIGLCVSVFVSFICINSPYYVGHSINNVTYGHTN